MRCAIDGLRRRKSSIGVSMPRCSTEQQECLSQSTTYRRGRDEGGGDWTKRSIISSSSAVALTKLTPRRNPGWLASVDTRRTSTSAEKGRPSSVRLKRPRLPTLAAWLDWSRTPLALISSSRTEMANGTIAISPPNTSYRGERRRSSNVGGLLGGAPVVTVLYDSSRWSTDRRIES